MLQLSSVVLEKAIHDKAAMAEWLRRLTRNQLGSSRVGSNPTRSDSSLCFSTNVLTCTSGGLVDRQYWETVL